jgi:hypothetical protein
LVLVSGPLIVSVLRINERLLQVVVIFGSLSLLPIHLGARVSA